MQKQHITPLKSIANTYIDSIIMYIVCMYVSLLSLLANVNWCGFQTAQG